MIARLYKIKAQIGILWWYTIIIFCVQRLGDIINMILGLWIVPHYVSQEQLGAVLPLVRVGSLLGLPLGILAIPFKKYLNAYAAHSEYGKIKSLLRDGFVFSTFCVVGIALYSRLVMPAIFERLRVSDTGLAALIIILGILNTIVPIFSTALQAFKDFRSVTVIGLFSAPIRLATMLVFLPAKGLSGYFIGHIMPLVYSAGVALWRLRHFVKKSIPTVPYLKVDGMSMLRYTVPVAVLTLLGALTSTTESLVIRHRLPVFDSAGFYIISRFADVSSYLGSAFALVLFPLVSERHEAGQRSVKMLLQSLGMILSGGLLLSLGLAFWGSNLLSLTSTWKEYISFAPQMALLAGIQCFRATMACFISHELACRRFTFVYWVSAINFLEVVFLYSITGFTFFSAYISESWLLWIASINPTRLSFILQMMGCFVALNFCVMIFFVARYIRASDCNSVNR